MIILLAVFLTACSGEGETSKSNTGTVDVSEVIDHFEESGFTIGEKKRLLAEVIGAEYGYEVVVNDSDRDVELYRFDINSADKILKETIQKAKQTGIFEFNDQTMDMLFNGEVAMYVSDEHPNKAQLEEAFMAFPDEYSFENVGDQQNVSKENIIDNVTNITGNNVVLGDTYQHVRGLLGDPDEEYGEGGESYLKYNKAILGFSAVMMDSGEIESLLTNVQREDLFSSEEEAISVLGEPHDKQYIEEINIESLIYTLDQYELSVWIDAEDNVTKVMLYEIQPSDGNVDDNQGEHSEEAERAIITDEITTDLMDGSFVTIQFKLVTDSEQSKVELEDRGFQVTNVLMNELSQMTAAQLEQVEFVQTTFKESINQLLSEGGIIEVEMINKAIR